MTADDLPIHLTNVDAHAVARQGDVATMSLLLDAGGIDPNLTDARGYGLLMIAAYNRRLEMVRLLLDRGADPDLRGPDGSTPLMGAAFKGFGEVVETLLQAGADRDAENTAGERAEDVAHAHGHHEIARRLGGG